MNNAVIPLFICSANVGRSQIAEGIFNHLYGEGVALSSAGGEARKEKYNGRPAKEIIELMKDYGGIDIQHQSIKYLADISEDMLLRVDRVIFLFDPKTQTFCDDACKIYGMTPYEYLQNKNFPISIYNIPDPYGQDKETWFHIYDMIKGIVEKI